MLTDSRIQQILFLEPSSDFAISELERIVNGDGSIDRYTGGETTIKAIQRLMIFLGYSTASSGAYIIDGDFGRGTNRGVAQFSYENQLPGPVSREILCYDCSFQNARKRITAIPDVAIDGPVLDSMLQTALRYIETGEIMFADFDQALFHLNRVEKGKLLTCAEIVDRYGYEVDMAATTVSEYLGSPVQKEWILAIIKQETGGVVRPRFEQHILSRRNAQTPNMDLAELRFMSTSFGLGQVMGFNFGKVGAPSAREMLFSPIDQQLLFVARFIAAKRRVVARLDPSPQDFRIMARYYNGPKYETHHYHERLETWFKEFRKYL